MAEEARALARRHQPSARVLDVHDAITGNALGREGRPLETLAAHRLHRVAPQFLYPHSHLEVRSRRAGRIAFVTPRILRRIVMDVIPPWGLAARFRQPLLLAGAAGNMNPMSGGIKGVTEQAGSPIT